MGILAAFLAGGPVRGCCLPLLTVSLQANQNITGLTLTTFGLGVYFFVGKGLKADRWPAMTSARFPASAASAALSIPCLS